MILRTLARSGRSYGLLLRFHRFLPAVEWLVRRSTGGRTSMMDLAGLPVIDVIAPGCKTGIMRSTTLQYVSDGNRLLIVGSNWAKPTHPAWSANLAAAQHVKVRSRNEEFNANVTMLVGPDRDRAWTTVLSHWPNYGIAQDKAANRIFRIFALTRI